MAPEPSAELRAAGRRLSPGRDLCNQERLARGIRLDGDGSLDNPGMPAQRRFDLAQRDRISAQYPSITRLAEDLQRALGQMAGRLPGPEEASPRRLSERIGHKAFRRPIGPVGKTLGQGRAA